MELSGALSNPRLLNDLQRRLLDKAEVTPREPGPAPPGRIAVLAAVTLVLKLAAEPMRARAIHRAAQELLGEQLRWSSVRGILSAYTIDGDKRFRWGARGTYELAKTE